MRLFRGNSFGFGGQQFVDIVAENQTVGGVPAAILEHFVAGDGKGPGHKTRSRSFHVEVIIFSPHHQARFLHDIVHAFPIREESRDKGADFAFVLGKQANEGFLAVG